MVSDKEYYQDIRIVKTAAYLSVATSIANIVTILFFCYLALGSHLGYGADFSFKYGAGFGQPNQDGTTETKYISLGMQNNISRILKSKLDFGAWFDSLDADRQKRSSGFTSLSLGMRVEPGYFYTETYWGISYITQTDTQLSTQFEFTEEVGFGVKDKIGKWMGLEYRHFSNAGIQLPNKGRDFALINVGIPL